MNIVYYKDIDLKIVPVRQFLSKYKLKSSDSPKQKSHKRKMVIDIIARIDFIAEINGYPQPPVAKPLHGHKYHEITLSDYNNCVRILYFCYHKERLILLNAFEKPGRYHDRGSKKKVDKEVKKILKQTDRYYNNFIKHPQKAYEKFIKEKI